MLHKVSYKAMLQAPSYGQDDADLICSGEDALNVLANTQIRLDEWRSLMEVTGGAIETRKSYYYLIDYSKQRGKWKAFDPDIGDQELSVMNKDGIRCALDRLNCSQPAEMLGVWMTMNGNKEKQIEVLRAKVVNWASLVRRGNCSQDVMWYSFKVTISKQIDFVLLAHTFTEEECKHILAPAIMVACQRAGFSARLRRTFRQTTSDFFGTGAMDLYRRSGALKVASLALHSWKVTPTMNLMKTNIESFVLEAGLYGNIWSHHNLRKAVRWCSSHSWIYYTVKFMLQHSIETSIPHKELMPNREGDKSIMQVASEFSFTDTQLSHINEVRMAHGVISISDLSVAAGSRIDAAFLHKSVFEGDRNQFKWPLKNDIKPNEYNSWVAVMNCIFPQGLYIGNLRRWTIRHEKDWTENWNWFVTPQRDRLWYREDDDWYYYEQFRTSRMRYNIQANNADPPEPTNLLRATVEFDGKYSHVISVSSRFVIAHENRDMIPFKKI